MNRPIQARQAEPSPQQTLLEYQAILENASVGIIFTRDRHVLHCNPRASEIFGWPDGELVGQPGSVFYLSEQDYDDIGRIAGPVLTSGQSFDRDMAMRRKDGGTVHCRLRAKAIDPHNATRGTIWIVEDISEKKAAAEALHRAYQELEQRVQERTAELEAVVRSSPLAIYTRDLQNRITSWNPAAEKMFGWTAAEVIGQPVPTVPASERAQADDLAHRISQGEALLQLEVVRQRRDGALIHISHTVAPLVDARGKLYGNLTIAADITESRAAAQKIEFLAYHDTLTGLPNRLLLQDRFEQAMAQAERNATQVALIFIDLDNFKQINDTLGHATGDLLLKEVAHRLRECVRDTDTISRQGGDEFVLVVRDLVDSHAAVAVVAKIMSRMQHPITVDGTELHTSVSVGAALYPGDGPDFPTLMKKADMAMYRAKEGGRNAYHFFNEEMSREATEHLMLRGGLRRALERAEFILHYQPQIDLASGRVTGVEALLRWNHPDHGLMPPDRFIPVAEDSGLIVSIGEWVVREACRQAAAWQQAGLPALVMAVNLSAVQFRRGNVEQSVIDALEQSGLAPSCLELEFTESLLIDNPEQVLAQIRRLKHLGIKISIDDFGTGYSSLSYLKRFDIDKLKIDRSFVRDLATDPDDVAIVRAIIQMAHSLNLKTIAEGVETPAMARQLREFQCDEAQGYHYARPLPAAECAAYLEAAQAA